MRLRDPKTRCIKRKIPKCNDILRTYDKVQNAYADILAEDNDIVEIFCNLPLEDKSVGDFVSDFVCTKSDGTTMVRECVLRTNKISDLIKTVKKNINDSNKEKANELIELLSIINGNNETGLSMRHTLKM